MATVGVSISVAHGAADNGEPQPVEETAPLEAIDCQLNTLQVKPGPEDITYWDQVAIEASGKRRKPTQGFLLKFTRPPQAGEDCIAEAPDEERVICVKTGDRVAEPELCPDYAEYEAGLEALRAELAAETDRVARVRQLVAFAKEYFERIPRCMKDINPRRVAEQLTVSATVPTIGTERVACNDERLAEASDRGETTHTGGGDIACVDSSS